MFLPTQFALDLQLLGGLWILQTFPAVVFGLFTGWYKAPALLAGWAVGFLVGSTLAWLDGFKPLHSVELFGTTFAICTGLLALLANVVVGTVLSAFIKPSRARGTDPGDAVIAKVYSRPNAAR